MYNSRPRRTNYEGYSTGIFVPENYSGNAFRERDRGALDEQVESVSETCKEQEKREECERATEPCVRCEEEEKCEPRRPSRIGFGFNTSKLFRGGIGFEELLIIGLILLIASSENNDDIIVLLALLFIG